jgi:hypothetical protein
VCETVGLRNLKRDIREMGLRLCEGEPDHGPARSSGAEFYCQKRFVPVARGEVSDKFTFT